MKKESKFQSDLIKYLKAKYIDIFILKQNSQIIQGFPDLLLLYKNKWAALEVKSNKNYSTQPNQNFYINHLNELSYASFIYPENIDSVLYELDIFFEEKYE